MAWQFVAGLVGLEGHLARYQPDAYKQVRGRYYDDAGRLKVKSFPGYVHAVLACYRAHFDPSKLDEEIERLEAEYADRLDKWADLPTARAKEMAKARFVHMDARLDELRRQRQDASQLVERQHRELNDLARAVKDARLAMTAEAGEQRYRQRA